MVRPVKLQSTPSGGYYNLGIGITDTGTVSFHVPTLGVAAFAPIVDVMLSPNPAQNYLNATISSDMSGVATMYVVNEMGQTIERSTKQFNKGTNYYSLNTVSLAPGMYFLVVKTGETTISRKWVKI